MTPNKPFMYHTTTGNFSFLQTSLQLADRGVKNDKFFLRLYDRRLLDVDPFDPYLTEEQKMLVIQEVMINPWYYLRECVRIPEFGSGHGTFFELHLGNLAAIFCVLNGIDHYTVLPSQTYKSGSYAAILNWMLVFGVTHTGFDFYNKSLDDNRNTLRRMQDQRKLLPTYLQYPVKHTANVNRSVAEALVTRNRIICHPSVSSIERAEQLGRVANPIQYFEEVEYTRHIGTILEASRPAYIAARMANRVGCRILTSIIGDPETNASAFYMDRLVALSAKWKEELYDMNIIDIGEYIARQSPSSLVYIQYDYTDLRKGKDWYEQRCRMLNHNDKYIKREVLLKRD